MFKKFLAFFGLGEVKLVDNKATIELTEEQMKQSGEKIEQGQIHCNTAMLDRSISLHIFRNFRQSLCLRQKGTGQRAIFGETNNKLAISEE